MKRSGQAALPLLPTATLVVGWWSGGALTAQEGRLRVMEGVGEHGGRVGGGRVRLLSLTAKALSDLNELDGGLEHEEDEAEVGLGVVEEILDGKATGGKGVL